MPNTPWTAQRLRETYLRFFHERGHAVIPSASLIPEHDPSVLFTTAGMHPLVPYLCGQTHPAGKRLTNVQKCVRTGDIDEVGDNRHLTFFEMLGNWSLGDYFKEDAIRWSFELLTGKEWFGLDPKRLAVSVFAGDADAARDEESASVWLSLGLPEARIAYLGKDDNWWPAGGKHPGPQGPDTEMFIWIGEGDAPEHFDPKDDHWVEVWNDVFMQFNRTPDGTYAPLAQQNVDTGMGLERMLTMLTGKQAVYETSLFQPILKAIDALAATSHTEDAHEEWIVPPAVEPRERHRRIIADHLRAAVFMLGDPFGIAPSKDDQGYVLRKLIRRAIRSGRSLGITQAPWTSTIAEVVISHYQEAYPELEQHRSRILFELTDEEERFHEVLDRGLRRIQELIAAKQGSLASRVDASFGTKSSHSVNMIPGKDIFDLYQSYGFPPELTREILAEYWYGFLQEEFDAALCEHQKQSRASTGQRFQGGLADHSDQSIRYHTATHLTHQALRKVLGEHVEQRGSNITPERMRFDFVHPEKLTPEQVQQVEVLIQQQIDADLPVHYELMRVDEAKSSGVIGLFEDAYAKLGAKVKVYFIGDPKRGFFSKEICGGPHVARTGLIGTFHITKEEAVSRGVRRIRAVVDAPPEKLDVAGLKGRTTTSDLG